MAHGSTGSGKTAEPRDGKPRKCLAFAIDGREYAVEAINVSEILRVAITKIIPGFHDFPRGAIVWRGTLVPVVELRERLGAEPVENTQSTSIVIVRSPAYGTDGRVGLVVDDVFDVFEMEQADILPTCESAAARESGLVACVARTAGRTRLLLDIEAVLTDDERAAIRKRQAPGRQADGPTDRFIAAMSEEREHSARTQSVIRTMEDIARQSKLAALNVAIEADHAVRGGERLDLLAQEVWGLARHVGDVALTVSRLVAENIEKDREGGLTVEQAIDILNRPRETDLEDDDGEGRDSE